VVGRDTPDLSISREVAVTVGSKLLQIGFGFVGIILFTQLLGNEGLGQYRTVVAAAFVVVQLSAGTADAVKKRVSEVGVTPDEYLTFGVLVHGGITLVMGVGIALTAPVTVPYFGSPALAAGVVLITGALGLFTLLNRFQVGLGYPGRASWFDTLRSVLTLGAQVGFLVLGFRAFGVVAGLALATALSAVLVWLSVAVPPAVPTALTARRTYEFARHSVPTNLLADLYRSADPLLIRAFAGQGAVGYYAVATRLVVPGSMLASSINSALSVKSSGVDSVGGDVRADLVNSASYAGLVSIPILFGALAIPDALMTSEVFGSTYQDAPGLVLIGMALFGVSNTYRQPFDAILSGTDRPEVVFRVNLAVTLLYLPFAVGLGFQYGLLGVVAGTVIAEAGRIALYQWIAARSLGGTVFPRPVRHQILAGVAMFAAVETVSRWVVAPNRWPVLLAVICFGAVVYFAALTSISSHFRDTVRLTLGSVT
jgi:O-antigen/teichoic acid export membrane protein